MTAPVTITINGTSYNTFLEADFTIHSVLGKTVSTLDGTIHDPEKSFNPEEGQDVIVTRGDVAERIFGGLTSIIAGKTSGTERYWEIKAQSYSILLDRIICYYSFPAGFTNPDHPTFVGDKAVLAWLFEKAIVGEYGQLGTASEITVGSYVQTGSQALGVLNFFYSYLREAVELLADYVGYNYYVDYNKQLHYYLTELNTAPFALSSTPGETLGGLTAIGYRNLRWKIDGTRLVNNYLILGNSRMVSNTQTGYKSNDGANKEISIAFKGKNIAIEAPANQTTVLVWINSGTDLSPSWTAQTVGRTGIDTGVYDCMWDSINQTLTFTNAPPNLTYAVKVQYVFPFAGGLPYTNNGSRTKYSRLFSKRLTASDASSASNMQSKIRNLDKQFPYGLEVLTCSVDDGSFPVGNTNRFVIGQYVPVKNAVLGINKSYWIHAITTKILGGTVRSYDLELRNYTSE